MSNLDKNILITPNIGSASSDPKIDFFGADATTGPSTISAVIYPTNNGTLNFQASEGTLFSISNSLSSGSIFSVNPISGIPIIDVNADRTIALNPFGGNTGIGTTNPTSKLHIVGDVLITGVSTLGVTSTTNLTAQQLNVSGVSTFAGITTVTGTTFFTRQLSVSGVSTIGNFLIAPVGTGATVGGIGVTYYGDGSQLSGISAAGAVSISTDTTNQNQLIPYVTSFGSTTGFGVTTLFVFNPSTGNLGIGTTNPTSRLQVQGDVSIASTVGIGTVIDIIPYDTLSSGTLSFEGSAGQLFSITNNLTSGSIFSVNDVSGIPSIDVNADGTVTLAPYADGNVGIATTLPTSRLHVVGDVLVTGVVTATTFYGDGSQLSGVSAGVSISTNTTNTNQYIPYVTSFGSTTGFGVTTLFVFNPSTGNLGIGTTNPTSRLYVVGDALVTGVSTIGNFRITPVGTGATVGQAGIVTYYGDGSKLSGVISPESNGEFYTGVSSSIQLTPLSYETSIYTFPSTAGKQYVIESINVANVDTSVGVGTTVNIIASIENSTGEQTYIAYNVPITNGGLIELLKNPIVAGPSDVMKMWSTNDAYTGVSNATEVYMNYTEFTSTEYINEYASTVSIATTDPTAVYTSTTYPSTIEAIHFANRTDIGDYPISVSITNGTTTTYLAKNLIIPRYATVDILDRPKRVETNGVIKVEVAQTSTIDVIIAGKQITS